MQYKVAAGLLVLLSACAPVKDVAMTNEQLSINAKCRGNDRCLFEGADIFLDITITNVGTTEVGLPLAFLQQTGPVIRLTDTRTKAETDLKTNLADLSLRDQYTSIPAGKSVAMEWVITAGELQQFGAKDVDVSAEITIKTDVLVSGKKQEFSGSSTLHIKSKI